MSLTKVEVTSEVFWTCTSHAMSTEAEEVMGLLLGDIMERPDGQVVARVWIAMPQIRSDRRKDRVEASPEQLTRCAAAAEQFTSQGGVATRVIGWYHSHPHITVLPSHVDIKTQASYQMLDQGFVGLIFSTFNQDPKDKSQSVSVTAFQSLPADEETEQLASPMGSRNLSLDADMAHAIQLSLAEARGRGSADTGQWRRKGVPLHIVKSQGPMERTLTDLVALVKVLFQEEQKAFHAAMAEATDREGNIDPLVAMQHGAMYQQNLCHLMELAVGPTLQSMQARCTEKKLQPQLAQLASSLQQFTCQHAPQHVQHVTQPGGKTAGQPAQLTASMADLLSDVTSLDVVPSTATPVSSSSSSTQGQQNLNGVSMGVTGPSAQSHGVHVGEAGQWQQQAAHAPHSDSLALPPDASRLLQDIPPAQIQGPQHGAYQSHQAHSASESSQHLHYQPQHGQYQPQLSHSDSSLPSHMQSQSQSQSQLFPPAPAWSQGQPQLASQSQSMGSHGFRHTQPETVNVSIITPAVWTSFDAAQNGQQQSAAMQQGHTPEDVSSKASAPPLPFETEQLNSSSAYSSSAPAATHQHWPQPLAQTDTQSGLPPVAAGNSRRSIGTNTQLRMQRSSPSQRAGQVASALADQQAQGPQADALSRPGSLPSSPIRGNSIQAEVSQAGGSSPGMSQGPSVKHSNSVGSLSSLASMDGLDRRASGQTPMRAGSPALGAGGSSRPPAWSAAKHDPFGDLVSQGLRSTSSKSIDSANLQGPTS